MSYREELETPFKALDLPEYMFEGLMRYIEYGIPPGSFLTAVLENDLRGAVMRADRNNTMVLAQWVEFLYNYAPAPCWGSKAKVGAWVESHEAARERLAFATREDPERP